MKKSNTIYIKKSELDQFYTSKEIADICYLSIIKIYNIDDFSLFLEPSAGNGSFYNLFPYNKKIGLDLDPKCDGVIKKDFFDYKIDANCNNIIVIGNPPFGKNSSLAVKFFNKSAEFAKVIAFIVPKTFKKNSLKNRLNDNFHLKFELDLPKNSFVLNNIPYDVPCCFQVWEKMESKREKYDQSSENIFFKFVKKENADFAVRRVGGRAGKAIKDFSMCSETSHYFLKMKGNRSVDKMINFINKINFNEVVKSTAGVKSLSKPELIYFILKNKESKK